MSLYFEVSFSLLALKTLKLQEFHFYYSFKNTVETLCQFHIQIFL